MILRNILFIGMVFLNITIFAQKTVYTVTVPDQYQTKSVLSQATDNIPNSGRYLVPGGFRLILDEPAAEDYVRSVFETVGVTVIDVKAVKSEVSEQAVDKAGGVNCGSAQLLCSNTSQTANSSGYGNQELNGSNHGCLSGNEHQSSWYYLNVQTGGILTMNINPNNTADDYDFAIWGPFTSVTAISNCPPVSAPVRCSYSGTSGTTGLSNMNLGSSNGCGFLGLFPCPPGLVGDVSEGAGGDRFVLPLTTTPNEIYILLVDNFSNSGNAYNMDFGGTSTLGCTPVVLPVELSSFSAEKSSNGNILSWITESEDRSDYFTVEWTTDPISNNWAEVAKIYAAGQSESQLSYTTVHTTPSTEKVNYYRLSLTDTDGEKTVYSDKIRSIQPNGSTIQLTGIYNLLGQRVTEDYHGVVIYQYADGTSRKVNQ